VPFCDLFYTEGNVLSNTFLLTNLVIFTACFTQSLSGFGLALITMSLLPSLIGLQSATPLVALIGIVLEAIMVVWYRESLQVKSISRLLVASLIAIPIGVIYFHKLDERIALFILGLLVILYALYGLIGFRLPEMRHKVWEWVFGFASGLLGGAYNVSGPPVIVYGNSRKWPPKEFKSNLAGFFLIGSLMVTSVHWLNGNITSSVFSLFLQTLPALLLGFILSQFLDRWLNPELFRKIVLILLVVLGARLMV
jgi:hypothetical protein